MMHPNGVYDAKIEGQTLKLYAPCVPIHNMGCTLGGGTITLEISSPLKNVIIHDIVEKTAYNVELKEKLLNMLSSGRQSEFTFRPEESIFNICEG